MPSLHRASTDALIILHSCFFNVLLTKHLDCWRYFVSACRLLCQNSELNLIDAFQMFCKTVESLYGEYEFWLFSFEWYNGILGKQPTNNQAVEPQPMKKFLNNDLVNPQIYPNEFKEDFGPLLSKDTGDIKAVGSLLEAEISSKNVVFRTAFVWFGLSASESEVLGHLYMKLSRATPASIFAKYSFLTINGWVFRVIAVWDENFYGFNSSPLPSSSPSPVTRTICPILVHF